VQRCSDAASTGAAGERERGGAPKPVRAKGGGRDEHGRTDDFRHARAGHRRQEGRCEKVLTVAIAGIDGVPVDAASVQLNVVASGDKRASNLVVYAAGGTRPSTVTEYINAHQSVASGALVTLGVNGDLSIYNKAGTAKVEVDVEGYVSAADSSQAQANAAAITTLSGGVSTATGQISTLTGQVSALTSEVSTLKTLLTGVTRTSFGGYPTLQFSGMNLQVVNGTGRG